MKLLNQYLMKKTIIAGGILGMGFLFGISNAQAQDLFVNPKRVVFDGQKRIQELNVANIGKDSSRYMISFIQIRMKQDGSFEEITQPDSGQNFADKNLRVFPRTITLPPNEAQVVKIQVTNTTKLLPGEYRSHLYFRAVPKQTPLDGKSEPVTKGVSVQLTPVYGISIPVIIRSGNPGAKVHLSNLNFRNVEDDAQVIEFRINRAGNKSVYGNLLIQHISPEGKVNEVGNIKGIAVYTPTSYRNLTVKLNSTSNINYRSGKLRVLYTNSETEKSGELATSELILK
jgi:hypothetical protein